MPGDVIKSEGVGMGFSEYPPVQRPIAPPPVLPDEKKIRAQHEHAAVKGIGPFKRAATEVAALTQQAQSETVQAQAALDEQWQRLRRARSPSGWDDD